MLNLLACAAVLGVELRLGKNLIDGTYTLPAHHDWTGAPANFTAVHTLSPTMPAPMSVLIYGTIPKHYRVIKTSLWVVAEKAYVDWQCAESECTYTLRSANASWASIAIGDINTFSPREMHHSGSHITMDNECVDGDLVISGPWTEHPQAWIYRVHLDALIQVSAHPNPKPAEYVIDRISLPLRLENGRCDVYYAMAN